ncbi:MAG TPA: hypothetical protein VJA94_08685 [Candidatus Angelobacter sp.]
MKTPDIYLAWRESIGFDEFSLGSGGIRIFPLAEIDEAQIGYSRSAEGDSLCDGAEGSWKPKWVVIGYETGLGDPIILDTSGRNFQVMTAMQGEGSWEPRPIAKSLEAFATTLRAIRQISVGRENPVAVDENPLSTDERERTLQVIRDSNNGEVEMDFWEVMLPE